MKKDDWKVYNEFFAKKPESKNINEFQGLSNAASAVRGMFAPKPSAPAPAPVNTPASKRRAICPFCQEDSVKFVDKPEYYPNYVGDWVCSKCGKNWAQKDAEMSEPGDKGVPGAMYFPMEKARAPMGESFYCMYLSGLITEQDMQDDHLVGQMAAQLHDDWRKPRLQSGTHGQPDAVYEPRMKPSGLDDGQEVDIAQHYSKLTPKWQSENKAAAQTAISLVRNAMQSGKNAQSLSSGPDLEALSSAVHDAWMQRNPKADYNAAQHVPYASLPEEEKQKDRDHVLMAVRHLSGQ